MSNAEKISVTMTPEMIQALKASVESGEYASTSEALRDAVRMWQRDRDEYAERIASIRARIQASIDDPRPSLSEDDVEADLARLHAETLKSLGDAAA